MKQYLLNLLVNKLKNKESYRHVRIKEFGIPLQWRQNELPVRIGYY
jgi:hypothetical protein